MFADSDIQFIRHFDEQAVINDGWLRLHRIPGAKQDGEHLVWHKKASTLLGTTRAYAGADYVGQLVTWSRENLIGLKLQIEDVTRRPWHRAVSRSLRISEYILYGVYVDRVLPLGDSGHFNCEEDLCHCCWFTDEVQALRQGDQKISRGKVALLLQSNLGLNINQEGDIAHLALAQAQTH
jgi:hypothetical protein